MKLFKIYQAVDCDRGVLELSALSLPKYCVYHVLPGIGGLNPDLEKHGQLGSGRDDPKCGLGGFWCLGGILLWSGKPTPYDCGGKGTTAGLFAKLMQVFRRV